MVLAVGYRFGKPCGTCRGLKHCTDRPTDLLPAVMDCPSCGGGGCDFCDEGMVKITDCPLLLITQDVWEAVELAELYEKGLAPVAGGVLDQAACFIEAARLIWRETARHKKRLGLD